ncbi:PREDICTED: uncharacterized protein LOC106108065 isoform X1 [Papilio polytes]|uniref:uncharacterized protein LOC106108065 isoform X1 n=1 Tax=Papilio polytes TaxID=76194 RepID=UPI0006760E45|nr:PREDICTED: uncharacterized protein LOC106108065 isoform X1 [Papilio polytes]
MMHMWMWFGYDLGEFLFPGLEVSSRWAFALTWIVLFFVAFLFEGSKVYLAKVQREGHKKLYPYRSDERRNLLCDRPPKCADPLFTHRRGSTVAEQGGAMEPTTSRNASTGQVSRWASLRVRVAVTLQQSAVFILHNTVGYLLMLAVMLYNVHLLLAVVFGMMLGYFLFGTKLTRLQMQCFRTKRVVICTPECDDTADNTTPPLLNTSTDSEADFFICRTRTCIQPSHYFPASTSRDSSNELANATCYYGAKKCPSKVARAKKIQAIAQTHCHHTESEKEDSPSVEDVQLLRTERQGCCKKKQEPPPEEKCCKSQSEVPEPSQSCCQKTESQEKVAREDSPHITCCHGHKSASTDSQEQIMNQ